MRISINEILVIVIIFLVVRILLDPDSMPLQRLKKRTAAMAQVRKEEDRKRALAEEEMRRRNTRCHFRDGFRASEFEWMVRRAGRYFPWIADLEISGPIVHGTLVTSDGSAAGEFTIDFNDYGHVTGRYWIHNSVQSDLPSRLAECINRELEDWRSGDGRKAYAQMQRTHCRSVLKRALPALLILILLVIALMYFL